MSKPLESKIENYLKEQIKRINGLCYKFQSSVNGVPDQIVIYNGHIYFVEVKRPGEKPRANQIHIHKEISERGVSVHTVDSINEVHDFMRQILKVEPVKNQEKTVKRKSKIISKSAFDV